MDIEFQVHTRSHHSSQIPYQIVLPAYRSSLRQRGRSPRHVKLQVCSPDMPLQDGEEYVLVVGAACNGLAEFDVAMFWPLGVKFLVQPNTMISLTV